MDAPQSTPEPEIERVPIPRFTARETALRKIRLRDLAEVLQTEVLCLKTNSSVVLTNLENPTKLLDPDLDFDLLEVLTAIHGLVDLENADPDEIEAVCRLILVIVHAIKGRS